MQRVQTLIFTVAVTVSAFLLFLIQPLFAKMILPVLGGSSAVWTTCMLFFQASLLGGYFYAHCLTKYLPIRAQVALHLTLVIAAFLLLPLRLPAITDVPQQPVSWVLFVALQTIGLPFIVIAASAPLLQRWFSLTTHTHRANPYFLYAASNIGSMAALIAYPFGIEAMIGLSEQKHVWMVGYGVLGVSLICAGLLSIVRYQEAEKAAIVTQRITRSQALSWVILAAIPSSLMLGLTSFVTTDIAAISLFWVVPLGLYLLTFILVFGVAARVPLRWIAYALGALFLLAVCTKLMMPLHGIAPLGFHVAFFFLIAWFFHGHLAASKPETGRLTEFYLWMSLGGMLGGLFNAVIAPVIFILVAEYYMVGFISLALVATMVRQPAFDSTHFLRSAFNIMPLALAIALLLNWIFSGALTDTSAYIIYASAGFIGVACAVLVSLKKMHPKYLAVATGVIVGVVTVVSQWQSDVLLRDRSFYGAMDVKKSARKNPNTGEEQTLHTFAHGTTIHGAQIYSPESAQRIPMAYYHSGGLFGDVARGYLQKKGKTAQFAVLGLGAGGLTTYAKSGDTVTLFEIDQKVIDIAQNPAYFTYLSSSPAKLVIKLGDARLKLAESEDAGFDVLFMDAFSSDAVPVHLLTQEAIDMYLKKIKPTGAIAIHISNRYLDLKPVIAGYTLPSGYAAYCGDSLKRTTKDVYSSRHILCLITRQSSLPDAIKKDPAWEKLSPQPGFTPWTDDFSNIYSVFKSRPD